jgi:amino acid permease
MNDNEFWFSIIFLIGVVIMLRSISMGISGGMKAFYEGRQYWGKNQHGVPPLFQKLSDKAMAERDQDMTELKERIEVLERIVTDQHNQAKARKLADDIDSLNT